MPLPNLQKLFPISIFRMGMFGTWVAMFSDWTVKSVIYVSAQL